MNEREVMSGGGRDRRESVKPHMLKAMLARYHCATRDNKNATDMKFEALGCDVM